MMQQVRDFHATHPLEEWMPMATLRASVVTDQEAFDVALAGVLRDGGLESRQGGVRCPGWVPVLDDALVREREWLVSRLRASGGEPPSVSDLRSERGGNDPIPLLRILERERLVAPWCLAGAAWSPGRFTAPPNSGSSWGRRGST